jgi:hypothetical protein
METRGRENIVRELEWIADFRLSNASKTKRCIPREREAAEALPCPNT